MNIRYRVDLSDEERTRITALLKGAKHAARKSKRPQILLAAGARISDEIVGEDPHQRHLALSARHAGPRRTRSPSSLVSRSFVRGRVEISSSPRLRWAMASVRAMRLAASSPAAFQRGMAASARLAAVR
jgi:anti-sigma factor RsiW